MWIFRVRLLQLEQDKQMAQASQDRCAQVRTADRWKKTVPTISPTTASPTTGSDTDHRLPEVLEAISTRSSTT